MGRHQRPKLWLKLLNMFGWFRTIRDQQKIAAADAAAAVYASKRHKQETDILAKKAWEAMGGHDLP